MPKRLIYFTYARYIHALNAYLHTEAVGNSSSTLLPLVYERRPRHHCRRRRRLYSSRVFHFTEQCIALLACSLLSNAHYIGALGNLTPEFDDPGERAAESKRSVTPLQFTPKNNGAEVHRN